MHREQSDKYGANEQRQLQQGQRRNPPLALLHRVALATHTHNHIEIRTLPWARIPVQAV